MDYTKGSLDIHRSAFIGSLIKHGGPPAKINVQFTPRQLLELVGDSSGYSLERGPAVEMVSEVTIARVYKKTVYDCENRAFAFLNDLAEYAASHGWEKGWMKGVIGYRRKETGGYHAAPVLSILDRKIGDHKPVIVEAKYLREDGSVQPEQWREWEDEVGSWGWIVCPT